MMDGRVLSVFQVEGRARTKGSLKVYCLKNRAHTVRVEEETKDSSLWRRRMAKACQVDQLKLWGKLLGFTGPVEVRLAVFFPRTLSVNGGVIPSHQTDFPTDVMLGDLDKLQRNLGDALEDSRLILNDSQITDWAASKRWAPDGSPGWIGVAVYEVTHG